MRHAKGQGSQRHHRGSWGFSSPNFDFAGFLRQSHWMPWAAHTAPSRSLCFLRSMLRSAWLGLGAQRKAEPCCRLWMCSPTRRLCVCVVFRHGRDRPRCAHDGAPSECYSGQEPCHPLLRVLPEPINPQTLDQTSNPLFPCPDSR